MALFLWRRGLFFASIQPHHHLKKRQRVSMFQTRTIFPFILCLTDVLLNTANDAMKFLFFKRKVETWGALGTQASLLAGVEFCEVWKESKKNWDIFSWLYENTLILQSGFLLVDGFIVPGIGENRLVSFLRGLGDRSTHLSRSFYSQTKTSWESSFWNRRTADLGGLNSRRQSLALPVHLWQPKVMPHLDLSMALKSMVSPYLFSQQLIFLGKQIQKK